MPNWGGISIGVSHGAILGSLLFALYINCLPAVTNHCLLDMCADDTEQSYIIAILICMCLQFVLDSVATWLHSSCLRINLIVC